MKMVLVMLKMPTLRGCITVSVMTMALMQMKHGCMGIGFTQRIMVFSVTKQRVQKGLHQITLHEGSLHIAQSKGFARKGIEQISRSVRAYVYLVLTSQVKAR